MWIVPGLPATLPSRAVTQITETFLPRVGEGVDPMARPSALQQQPNVGGPAKAGLVYPGLKVPFILLIACFAAWGAAANLTDVLVGVFRQIFTMSNFQSALVQFAYYGAYFALAIPAALINRYRGS